MVRLGIPTRRSRVESSQEVRGEAPLEGAQRHILSQTQLVLEEREARASSCVYATPVRWPASEPPA